MRLVLPIALLMLAATGAASAQSLLVQQCAAFGEAQYRKVDPSIERIAAIDFPAPVLERFTASAGSQAVAGALTLRGRLSYRNRPGLETQFVCLLDAAERPVFFYALPVMATRNAPTPFGRGAAPPPAPAWAGGVLVRSRGDGGAMEVRGSRRPGGPPEGVVSVATTVRMRPGCPGRWTAAAVACLALGLFPGTAHAVPAREFYTACAELTGGVKPLFTLPTGLLMGLGRLMDAVGDLTGEEPLFTTEMAQQGSLKFRIKNDKAVRELGYTTRPWRESLEDSHAWYAGRGMI